MSQIARQRNLFAAEDFTVIYDSFKQANFQSYDYDTIRTAMVDYIKNRYPENFNDWIKSSEFVALVELMSFLGHNLAFRADLAVRENFLSTAERRESVLRIADFLGYNATRPYPASGYLKIKSIKTNQNVYDIKGASLKNKTVSYYDDTDPTSYQNFLLVLNEVFSSTNKFGSPNTSSFIDGIENQLYRLNNKATIANPTVYPFRARVNGLQQTFEIHNISISSSNKIEEPSPNPYSGFNILYKNDRQGLLSKNTGFFVGFKQGITSSYDYIINSPIPNMSIDINVDNINNIDVWVQNVDENNNVLNEWVKVDRAFGASALFNSLDKNIKKIFSVKTLQNNNVSVIFGDGNFSEMPSGIIRTWYRSSINQSYVLNPDDVGTINFTLTYIASDNNEYNVTFTVELEDLVTNASSAESLTSIKENAGRVFSTQDRMITSADYNVYPLAASSNIAKIKSINRTYSGHSRFLKLNDPTSQYQNANVFGDDGYLYYENSLGKLTIPVSNTYTNSQLYDMYVRNLIENVELINFYYNSVTPYVIQYNKPAIFNATKFEWQQITAGPNSSSGYITRIAEPNATNGTETIIRRVGNLSDFEQLINIKKGAIVEFIDPANNGESLWARVIDIFQDGLGLDDSFGNPTGIDTKGYGSIKLSKLIPDGFVVKSIYYSYSKKFTESEKIDIVSEISNKNTFGLRYDYNTSSWKTISASNLAELRKSSANSFSMENSGDLSGNNLDDSWLIRFDYTAQNWSVSYRKFRIIFGSEDTLKFYNQNYKQKFNIQTGKPERDKIRVLPVNTMPNNSNSFGRSVDLFIYQYFAEPNGYTDDHKVIVTLSDIDNDGYPDNPASIKSFIGSNTITLDNFIEDGYTYTAYSSTGNISVNGRNNIKYQFTRVADSSQRIDPSISNIIDTFVLTKNYDTIYRNWMNTDRRRETMPLPPTTDELSSQFNNIESKKSISDTVIYRSARYKSIFGSTSDIGLQAKFRVVKSSGTTLTDTEIKSRVIQNIQNFFDINNWDFGETFYYTEMAAYIHNKMAGIIGSIVIVPVQESSAFGNLFQVTPNSDELFIPDVTLESIEIVTSYTEDNLRIRK